jgi:hypothetical protein
LDEEKMKHEFKVTKSKEQTVYTLESATGGSSSTSDIASTDSTLGGMQRRNPPGDNILAQEKKEAPKPRNFVAKNAKMGGAGQHKDKKKAEKQGDVKHKNKQMDMAEGLGKDIKRLATGKDVKSRAGQEIAKSQDASMKGDTKTSKKHFDRFDKLDKLANKEQGVAEGLESSIDLLKKLDAMIKNFVQTRGQMGGQRLSAGMLPILNNLEQLGEKDIAHGIKNMVLDARNSERATKGASWSVLAQGLSQKLPELIRNRMKQGVAEEWSQKYKSSINCSHPKGFSQKAHCAGKKKHEESMMTMEAVCPDCGMCETHGNVMEIKKGQKDANGFTRCWPGKHAVGTKKGKNGGQVRDCRPNEGVAEDHEIQMASSELQSIAKNAVHLLDLVRKYSEEEGLDAWQQSKITKAADYLNSVLQSISGEQTNLEGVGMPFRGVGGAFNRGDDERHDLDVPRPSTQVWALKINGQVDSNNVFNSREQALKHRLNLLAKNPELEIGLVTKGGVPEDAYMESLQNMLERSVSQAQHNLMVGVAHNPQFAQKVKVKQSVGQEFARADQGHDISKLPIRVPKKK